MPDIGHIFEEAQERLKLGATISYNCQPVMRFIDTGDWLTPAEGAHLNRVVRAVGDATIARRFIDITGPLGAGIQTVPTDKLVGITEGYKSNLGSGGTPVKTESRGSGIIPIISKDFILHWRDIAEARVTHQGFPSSKAAAAASMVARSEDKLVLFGHQPYGYVGLMTIEGRSIATGMEWTKPGDAFENFRFMTKLLKQRGHSGPFAAVIHPRIYSDMHRVLKGSSLLEIAHVRALLTEGIFRSPLLAPRAGVVVSTGRQNLELLVSIDTSAAYLGQRHMNLRFRVLKGVYLRIHRPDAICTF